MPESDRPVPAAGSGAVSPSTLGPAGASQSGTMSTTRIHVSLILLSLSAGAADAFAFLALGGIFTANMTGNLILTAMFTRTEFVTTLWTAIVAVVAFAGVLYAAFRLTAGTAPGPGTPRRVVRRLVLPSLVIETVVVAIWLPFHGDGLAERGVVIALSSAALALQTVAAKKLSDVDGITTTYVTGTLTTTMQDLAERRGFGETVRILSILALPVGALAATAALAAATWSGPIVAWAAAALATGLLWLAGREYSAT